MKPYSDASSLFTILLENIESTNLFSICGYQYVTCFDKTELEKSGESAFSNFGKFSLSDENKIAERSIFKLLRKFQYDGKEINLSKAFTFFIKFELNYK